jgi:hypothetical protein
VVLVHNGRYCSRDDGVVQGGELTAGAAGGGLAHCVFWVCPRGRPGLVESGWLRWFV